MAVNKKSLANLKKFKKGESGNPNGQPKKSDNKIIDMFKAHGINRMTKAEALDIIAYIVSASENELNDLLDNNDIPLLYKAAIKAIKKDVSSGSLNAFDRLMDRFTGKPLQQVEQNVKAEISVKPTIVIGKKESNE